MSSGSGQNTLLLRPVRLISKGRSNHYSMLLECIQNYFEYTQCGTIDQPSHQTKSTSKDLETKDIFRMQFSVNVFGRKLHFVAVELWCFKCDMLSGFIGQIHKDETVPIMHLVLFWQSTNKHSQWSTEEYQKTTDNSEVHAIRT